MSGRKFSTIWTTWLLLIAATLVILEVWAIVTGGTTLSMYIREASQAWPIIPIIFIISVVAIMIHLWGPHPPTGPGKG